MGTREQTGAGTALSGVHPAEVLSAQQQVLDRLAVRHRHVETRGGNRVHVVEIGEGPPTLFLHGTNTSSVSFAPLLGHLEGLRVIAVDRPGRGLSDAAAVPRRRYRHASVAFVADVLDALELDKVAVVGQSGGGVWALWYAIARPERVRSVVLLGSVPLLPGTRCPAPLRAMATPVLGPTLARVAKPSPRSLVQLLSSVGEGETIVRYPDLIDALVAGGNDPVARRADLAELRALIHPFGFRHSMRFRAEELQSMHTSTLLIWGDRDPVGSVDVAEAVARLLPNAVLRVLPAGHVPQLGDPEPLEELYPTPGRSLP